MIARGKGKATGYTDFYKASGERAASFNPGNNKNWNLSINFGQGAPDGFPSSPFKKNDDSDAMDARKRALQRRLRKARKINGTANSSR
jgi:hypothetical protein